MARSWDQAQNPTVSQSHDGQCALFLWALDFLLPGLWCVCNCGRSGGPSIPSHAPQESTKGAKQSLAYRASFQVLLANLQGPPASSSALDPEQPSSALQVKPKKQGDRAYHKDLYIADGGGCIWAHLDPIPWGLGGEL